MDQKCRTTHCQIWIDVQRVFGFGGFKAFILESWKSGLTGGGGSRMFDVYKGRLMEICAPEKEELTVVEHRSRRQGHIHADAQCTVIDGDCGKFPTFINRVAPNLVKVLSSCPLIALVQCLVSSSFAMVISFLTFYTSYLFTLISSKGETEWSLNGLVYCSHYLQSSRTN
jgi:hypothetical protein